MILISMPGGGELVLVLILFQWIGLPIINGRIAKKRGRKYWWVYIILTLGLNFLTIIPSLLLTLFLFISKREESKPRNQTNENQAIDG